MRIYVNILVFTTLTLTLTIVPIMYLHEYGHAVVCEAYGGTMVIGPITGSGIDARCLDAVGMLESIRFAGGFIALLGSSAPLLVYNSRLKHNRIYLGILTACLSQALVEGTKSYLEPYNYAFYETDAAGVLFLVMTAAGLFGFALLFRCLNFGRIVLKHASQM